MDKNNKTLIIPNIYVEIVEYLLIFFTIIVISKIIYMYKSHTFNVSYENYYWIAINTSLLIVFSILFIKTYTKIAIKLSTRTNWFDQKKGTRLINI